MSYIDGDGGIIVPKSVRPIIEYKETVLGSRLGAKRQFRYGNLHIREYDNFYVVHNDKMDPRKNPLGHLLIDAPEYLAGFGSAISVGREVGLSVYNRTRAHGKPAQTAICSSIVAGYLAGSAAGIASYFFSNLIKKKIKSLG